jgi:hypothetical protein
LQRNTSLFIGLVFSVLALGAFTPTTTASSSFLFDKIDLELWEPKWGDSFVIDTQNNEGYLIHTNGSFTQFPVITGQRRFVSYIGRYYNAATPTWNWTALSNEIKGDRVTFGPTGRFLRLYKDGETRTAYGIHEHRDEAIMFERDIRFQSMGCVIVRSSILDIIEDTYELNGDRLDVVTMEGMDRMIVFQ